MQPRASSKSLGRGLLGSQSQCRLESPRDLEEEELHLLKLKEQRARFEQLTTQFSRLEGQLSERDREVARLQSALGQALRFRALYEQERDQGLTARTELQRLRASVEEEMVQFRDRMLQREAEAVAEARARESTLQQELEDALRETRQLEFKLQTLRSNAKDAEANYRTQLNSIRSKWDQLKTQTLEAQRGLQRMHEQNQMLGGRVQLLQEELSSCARERGELLETIERLKGLLALKDQQLEEKQAQLQQQQNRSAHRLFAAQQESEKLQAEVRKLRLAVSQQTAEKQLRSKQLEQSRSTADLLCKKMSELKLFAQRSHDQLALAKEQLGSAREENEYHRRVRRDSEGRADQQSRRQACELKCRAEQERQRKQIQVKRRTEIQLIDELFQSLPQWQTRFGLLNL